MTTSPLSLGAEDQGSDCLYVSHLSGEDSPQCGSFTVPCRTLPQALFLVNDGGKICLNGKDSESNPYECLKRDSPNGNEFKTIEKSVSIQGVSSPAHISCGLVFASRSKYGSVKVSLSNLVFNNSRYGLVFLNVPSYHVVISKCQFINFYRAIFMLWQESQGSSFISQKSSLEVIDSEFRNNTYSIELSPKFKNGSVKVSLSNLLFDNGTHGVVLVDVPSYDVVISDCKFINCSKAIFMLWEGSQSSSFISQKSSLKVTDSEFRNNTFGIAFGPKFKNGSMKVSLSNLLLGNGTYGVALVNMSSYDVVIAKCKFFNFSEAAVVLLWNQTNFVKNSIVAADSKFQYNTKSIFVMLPNDFFEMTISRCLFQDAKGRFHVTNYDRNATGAVFVRSQSSPLLTYPFHVLVSITDSIFQDLGHKDNSFAVSVNVKNLFSDGNVSLFNTSFLNNENSVFVQGGFGLNLTQVTITSTYGYAITASAPPKTLIKAPGVRVFLEKCVLVNNRIGIRMSTNICLDDTHQFCSTGDQTLIVKNSLILGGDETLGTGDAIRFGMSFPKQNYTAAVLKPGKEVAYLSPDFEAKLLLENVTFQGLHDCALSVSVERNVSGLISVKNCRFLNNTQFVNRLDERAIVQIEFTNVDPPQCPHKRKGNKSEELMWNKTFELPVIFEDTLFENNAGIAGTLNLLNGNATLNNCTFKNNEGVAMGGQVYLRTGFGILNIVNSSFHQTSSVERYRGSRTGCFLQSESAGQLKVEQSSFTADDNRQYDPIFAATKSSSILIDDSSSFRCPSGRQITIEKITEEDGFELVKGSETCWIRVQYIKLLCEECPYDYYSFKRGWASGFHVHEETKCIKCPYGAKCERGNVLAQENFWGSKVNRTSSTLEFIPCPLEYCKTPTDSTAHAYNGCYGSRTGVLCGECAEGYSEALYSTSCQKKEKCHDHWFWLVSLIYILAFALYLVFKPPVFTWLYRQGVWFRSTSNSNSRQEAPNEDRRDKQDAGYLKITFYFYQVAEILMITSTETTAHVIPFVTPIVALFNFQVKNFKGSIGCPFPGFNVVTKELFFCLKFLATLFSIPLIYAIHRAISRFRPIPKPSLRLYLAVVLETLLLGYKTLADTSLTLMHCVPVELEWRLFIDGNIQCWQWWQYLQIVFILTFIIPLVLVLFWGSLMLSKDEVSAKEFLTSCAFPLPFLFIWLFRCCKRRGDTSQYEYLLGNSEDNEDIKRVLYDPFRSASDGDHGTLYWESVLVGRRFLLLTISTFITDPLTRFVCLGIACVLILAHHLLMRPFRDRKANICESLSLVSLTAICTFNLAKVTIIAQGLEPAGPKQILFHALKWIEVALLGFLPAMAFILVVLVALSQVVRLLYHCVKLLH